MRAAGVDWSGFLPDLIVGVVTGLIVGLAIYIFERSRRNAEAYSLTLAGWLMVAPRIERIVWQPVTTDTSNYMELGPVVGRVQDMADGYPLEHWQQTLKRSDLQALLDLLSEYDTLHVTAELAERMLETACYLRGIDSEIGQMVEIVARTQTFAKSDDDVFRAFAGPNEYLRKFIPMALALREHPPLAKAEGELLEVRSRTNARQIAFVNEIRLARSEAFSVEVHRDAERQLRRDYWHHPARTYRRERANRMFRAQAAAEASGQAQ